MFPPTAAGRTTPPAIPLTSGTVNQPEAVKRIAAGSIGPAVLRAQILLDRAHFSSGEIDGSYGTNLRRAIEGYQAANGLPVTGVVDAGTWTAMNADTADALTPYIIQDGDIAGPFAPVPADMMEQATLQQLGYANPVEGLAEKFHASPALLRRLNKGKTLTRAGEEIIVPNLVEVNKLPKASKVVVSRSGGTLTVLDAKGKVLAQFPATTGSPRDPLPIGIWKVTSIARNPTFDYNPALFWDAAADDKKVTIPAGPNNPVGVAWIDLSKEHYGIHGTPEPSTTRRVAANGSTGRSISWRPREPGSSPWPMDDW